VEGGGDYDLYCSQVDDETVRCTASKKVYGKVVVMFGGSTFWTSVTEYTGPSNYCYNVYDYDTSFTWKNYGTHCQENPAEYGDTVPWYNPDWDEYYDAEFLPEYGCAGIVEDAYYYTLECY
jgi:hypothetical protein